MSEGCGIAWTHRRWEFYGECARDDESVIDVLVGSLRNSFVKSIGGISGASCQEIHCATPKRYTMAELYVKTSMERGIDASELRTHRDRYDRACKRLLSEKEILGWILHECLDEFADVEGDADSLAGLLLEIKGDFLKVHETLTYGAYTFEVLEIDGRRISKIKVVVAAQGENRT